MSVITRGVKNTFRNTLRTIGFSVIIAISLGLAFSMLLANEAVRESDKKLREDIGANLLVHPVGSPGGSDTQTKFTDADAKKLAALPNVREVVKIISTTAQHPSEIEQNKKIKKENEEKANKNKDKNTSTFSQDSGDAFKTSLHSAVDEEQLKKNAFGSFTPMIPPVTIEGSTSNIDMQGNKIKPIEGRSLNPQQKNEAMIGEALAKKNNLTVGSTFTINTTTFTVVGIYTSGTISGDSRVLASFETVRTLLGGKDEIPVLLVTANSLESLESVKKDILTATNNGADVQSLQQEAVRLAAGLRSIQTISFATLVIALAAGTLTILLTMLLIVRERTKEIGVLKALGATNTKIVGQFMAESTVLTLIGAVIGMGFAMLSSNMILKALVSGNVEKEGASNSGGAVSLIDKPVQAAQDMAQQITTFVDWQFIVYGLGIAFGIALIATLIPALLIAKVRPAQIMRGDS